MLFDDRFHSMLCNLESQVEEFFFFVIVGVLLDTLFLAVPTFRICFYLCFATYSDWRELFVDGRLRQSNFLPIIALDTFSMLHSY